MIAERWASQALCLATGVDFIFIERCSFDVTQVSQWRVRNYISMEYLAKGNKWVRWPKDHLRFNTPEEALWAFEATGLTSATPKVIPRCVWCLQEHEGGGRYCEECSEILADKDETWIANALRPLSVAAGGAVHSNDAFESADPYETVNRICGEEATKILLHARMVSYPDSWRIWKKGIYVNDRPPYRWVISHITHGDVREDGKFTHQVKDAAHYGGLEEAYIVLRRINPKLT